MDRMACVDIRNLPLQILLRKKPEWKHLPVAVVDRDTLNGTIQYVNKRSREYRIRPGFRYGTALSLCGELCVGTVSPIDTEETVKFVTNRLWNFSPRVEPCLREPGIFWLDASGMRHLFPSLRDWAGSIRTDLKNSGFHSVLAVGFTRFGSYAAAKNKSGSIVFESVEEEQHNIRITQVDRLDIDHDSRDLLYKLDITTLGNFIALPGNELHGHFNPEVKAWHETAGQKSWRPLQPSMYHAPLQRIHIFDYPEKNADRLLFVITPLLTLMLSDLSRKHEALKIIHIRLKLSNGHKQACDVSPASPTLDQRQILLLIRLRLEQIKLTAGIDEIELRVTGETASSHQLDLFKTTSGRSLELANQAIAKLHAFLNQDAIVCAQIHDEHFPETQYRWETIRRIRAPQPGLDNTKTLVRRVFSPSMELPSRSSHEPDGWLIAGISEGTVEEVHGPYRVSGGWCIQEEKERAYYYLRIRNDRWLWVYHDQKKRQWFLQGEAQ